MQPEGSPAPENAPPSETFPERGALRLAAPSSALESAPSPALAELPPAETLPEPEPDPQAHVPPGLRLRYPVAAQDPSEDPRASSFLARHGGWIVRPTILLAGLLAHGLCLNATFYRDDWNGIVANDWVDHGEWWDAGPRALTYLTHWITYALAGISAPAFHAGNLLLHLTVALVLAGFARRYLAEGAEMPPGRARRIAWWAALLFAVHPLGSEVANYVRTRDIELVTLCSLLAAWAALRWRRQRRASLGWPLLTLGAVLAATGCKEVGFLLAAATAALVWFGLERSPEARRRQQGVAMPLPGPVTKAKTKLVVTPKAASMVQGNWPANLSLGLVAASLALLAWPAWMAAYHAARDPSLGWHALTEARVFWMYAWRLVLPLRLCSDHQIRWTRGWDDPVAWLSAVAELEVIVGVGLLYLRRRGPSWAVGTLLAIALWAVVHRLGNPKADLMVESRLYPALGPVCVLLAWGLDRLLQRVREPGARLAAAGVVMGGLVAAGATLSALRARTWHRPETLVASVLAQYPYQNRARQELQDADVRGGRWAAALKHQPAMTAAIQAVRNANARGGARSYDTDGLLATYLATEGNCALALANLGESQAAFARLDRLRGTLRAVVLNEPANRAEFLYEYGRAEAAVHDWQTAENDLAASEQMLRRPQTLRELRRVQFERRDQAGQGR